MVEMVGSMHWLQWWYGMIVVAEVVTTIVTVNIIIMIEVIGVIVTDNND